MCRPLSYDRVRAELYHNRSSRLAIVTSLQFFTKLCLTREQAYCKMRIERRSNETDTLSLRRLDLGQSAIQVPRSKGSSGVQQVRGREWSPGHETLGDISSRLPGYLDCKRHIPFCWLTSLTRLLDMPGASGKEDIQWINQPSRSNWSAALHGSALLRILRRTWISMAE